MPDRVLSLWIVSFFLFCAVEAEKDTARMIGKLCLQFMSEKFYLWFYDFTPLSPANQSTFSHQEETPSSMSF